MNTAQTSTEKRANLARIASVTVPVSVRLGHQAMTLADLCHLKAGTILPVSFPLSSQLELTVNNLVLAKGTIVRRGSQLGFKLSD